MSEFSVRADYFILRPTAAPPLTPVPFHPSPPTPPLLFAPVSLSRRGPEAREELTSRYGLSRDELVEAFGQARDEWIETDFEGWLGANSFYEVAVVVVVVAVVVVAVVMVVVSVLLVVVVLGVGEDIYCLLFDVVCGVHSGSRPAGWWNILPTNAVCRGCG